MLCQRNNMPVQSRQKKQRRCYSLWVILLIAHTTYYPAIAIIVFRFLHLLGPGTSLFLHYRCILIFLCPRFLVLTSSQILQKIKSPLVEESFPPVFDVSFLRNQSFVFLVKQLRFDQR